MRILENIVKLSTSQRSLSKSLNLWYMVRRGGLLWSFFELLRDLYIQLLTERLRKFFEELSQSFAILKRFFICTEVLLKARMLILP